MNSYNYTTKKIPASPRNKRLTDSILSAASTGGVYVGSAPSYWSLVGDMIVSNYSAASTGDIIAYLEGEQTSSLPIASPRNYGLVKYDGTTLKVDDEGRLYVAGGGGSGSGSGSGIINVLPSGTGNAVTSLSFDPSTNILTYNLGATFVDRTALDSALLNYVTISTDQVITGEKTFTENLLSNKDVIAYASGEDLLPALPIASYDTYGLVKIDGSTIGVNSNGQLTVIGGAGGGSIVDIASTGSGNAVTSLSLSEDGSVLTAHLDKQFATLDSTVEAANRLSTTRYLWGQSFDGSGNVKGVIKGVPYVSFETYDYEGGSAGYVGRGSTNSNDLSITTYGENSIEFFTNSLERMRITKDGSVGINTTTPRGTLDVNGTATFSSDLYLFNDRNIFINANGEGVYVNKNGIYWHNSDNTWHSSIMTCDGSATTIHKPLYIESDVHLTGSDQINGALGGIALNYNCGKYVNTSIWDGRAIQIMRVFGEGRQVAIGAHSIDTPRGTLNVDGEVIFEQSRFTTTSGFVDGDHAYSHAIYGGYHGIDVCEFYENRFHFRNNGGNIYLLQLTTDYASFCGAVYSSLSAFVGSWGNKERIRLTRDGEFNTWLQAGTDTTAENGRLYMSGLSGALLHQFNVWASVSNFKGSIIAEGDVTAYSDIRLKNRIESVNNVLDTINTLDVFRYTWKDREDKSVHIGVSAQQVQTIYPEFVLTSSSEDGTDYLTVNYSALATCIAIQGIKELAKKGDERDKKIVSLETEIKNLKERIKTLEAWS